MREGVWTHGRDTSLQAWVAGEGRTIVVTTEAIQEYLNLGPARAADISAVERRKFVEGHLAALRNTLRPMPTPDSTALAQIATGQFASGAYHIIAECYFDRRSRPVEWQLSH
jgi:hypothetical protein